MKLLTSNKQTLSNFLIIVILLFGLTSFLNMATRTIVDGKIIFELLFLLLSFLMTIYIRLDKRVIVFSIIIFIYLIFTLNEYILFETKAKISDYLIMYKSFIYLFLLSFFVGKHYLHQNFLRRLFNVLIALFIFKYLLMKFLGYGFQGRPELFTENNFELVMLLILYIGVYSREKSINKWDLIFLTIIFILSGSRSGMGAFFILLYFLDFGKSNQLKILKLFLLVVGIIGSIFIFLQRMGSGGVEDIDRVKFLMYFINEINSWNIFNYFFGASFMTPMSPETSQGLNYYHMLYSNHDKLLTYSVVLHSFVLRTIFDHGFLGLWFIFYTVWKFLGYCGYEKKEKQSVILILIVTGLSVSSLNSVFVAFSLGLIIITKRNIFERSL